MVKRIVVITLCVAGLAAFAYVLASTGVAQTVETVRNVGAVNILAFVFVCSMTLVIPAVGWWIIMRGEALNVRPKSAIGVNLMGFPLSHLTPSLFVGGEPVKIYYLCTKYGVDMGKLIATIIVSKFQELSSYIVLMMLCLIFLIWNEPFVMGAGSVSAIVIVLVLMTFFGIFLYLYINDRKPLSRMVGFLGRFGVAKHRIEMMRDKLSAMEEVIHQSLTSRWKRFMVAQSVTLLSALTVFLRPWIFFAWMGGKHIMGLENLCFIFILTNLTNTVQITPGSIGVFEGGIAAYFSQVGLSPSDAMAFALVSRISDIALLLIGLGFLTRLGLLKKRKEIAQEVKKETMKLEHEKLTERYEAK